MKRLTKELKGKTIEDVKTYTYSDEESYMAIHFNDGTATVYRFTTGIGREDERDFGIWGLMSEDYSGYFQYSDGTDRYYVAEKLGLMTKIEYEIEHNKFLVKDQKQRKEWRKKQYEELQKEFGQK